MIELKTPGEIDAMGATGRVVASVLAALRTHAAPGVTTRELDTLARDLIADAGATPTFPGYHPDWAPAPYDGAICASVNDAVVHSPPTDVPLREGDLLSLDLAVHLDGWCADAAVSTSVGEPRPADLELVAAAEAALAAGVAQARPGRKLGDLAHAIGGSARAGGYGMLRDHGGHGIGRTMHEAPFVPNEGRPGRGFALVAGLVLALEPMLVAGGDGYRHDPDGWTVRTADGSRAVHVEHTVAVTEAGPRVLTALARHAGSLSGPAGPQR